MYKLRALLPSGAEWVCTSTHCLDLQRIAANVSAVRYEITINGAIIYSQNV